MKQVLAFLLLSVLFTPLLAAAQTPAPYARYCPDPTQIFTGIAYDSSGKPRIELLVNPDFEAKMLREERKIGGTIPVTPVYDLVVRVIPTINEYCLPQYDANGTLIDKIEPPGTLPFPVYFALGNETLFGGTAIHYARQNTDDGLPYYEWEVKGWPNGIFISEKLEKVIKAVQENDPTLRMGVLVDLAHNNAYKVEKPISFELCVPLAGGNAPKVHKVVNMRGKSAEVNVSTLVGAAAEDYREFGFESIQPFKAYSVPGKSWFAHFVDLSVYDDTGWAMFFGQFFVGANRRPRAISACGDDGSQYFFHTGKMKGNTSYAPYGGGIAFMAAHGGVKPATIAMHEMGHSFGWLEDEYHSGFDVTLYYANCAPASQRTVAEIVSRFGPPSSQTTASKRAQIESLIKKSASASGRNKIMTQFERAYWDKYGDTVSGCHTNVQNRPSLKSMMNTGDFESDQFNVVSCGYLLRSITGEENLKSHWQECMKMEGLEKPVVVPGGVQAVTPISRLFALLKDSLFAAVAAPSATTDMHTSIDLERFINVETFSSDGKDIQSEIFENTGDENNPKWQQVKVEETEPAETAAKQYCPGGEKELFKGSIYHTDDGKPWIEVIVDPKFEQEELRGKRKITGNIPLTPVYNLVVRIKPEFNYYCIDGWDANKNITAGQLPEPIPVTAALVVGVKNEPIVDPVVFSRTDKKDEQGRFVYERKIKGWMNGIATDTKLERFITAIAEKEPINVLVTIDKKEGGAEKITHPVSGMNNCAPIWGSGKHKLIGMYGGKGTIPIPERVSHFDNVREKGFQSIQPMALEKYKPYFSYFVDLQEVTAGTLNPTMAIFNQRRSPTPGTEVLPYTKAVHNKGLLTIVGKSSCGEGGVHFVTINKEDENGIAMINDTSGRMGAVIGGSQPPSTYVHEWAHTFVGLGDAYTYEILHTGKDAKEFPLFLTNCSINPPFDYKYNNRLYGGLDYRGCSYMRTSPTARTEQPRTFYRPSFTSLMGGPEGKDGIEKARPEQFDVVSCAWVLKETIGSGSAQSYFPECAKMNGVIKDGVTAQNVFLPIFAWIEKLKQGSGAAADGLAAVATGFGFLK